MGHHISLHCTFHDYPYVLSSHVEKIRMSFVVTASALTLAIIPNLPFFFCVWRAWSHYKGLNLTLLRML